jgi:hypothetical protein
MHRICFHCLCASLRNTPARALQLRVHRRPGRHLHAADDLARPAGRGHRRRVPAVRDAVVRERQEDLARPGRALGVCDAGCVNSRGGGLGFGAIGR